MSLKRVATIGVIGFITILMFGATADAGTGTISGTSIKQCVCFSATGAVVSCSGTFAVKRCSIDVASILKGLGNVGSGPNAIAAAYDVTLFIEHATAFCVTKGGGTGGVGVPFGDLLVSQTDAITNKEIDKNGKALSDLFFTDEFILGPDFECPNQNWSGRVLVDLLQAVGRLFRNDPATNPLPPDPSQSCNLDPSKGALQVEFCTLVDALGVACEAPGGASVSAPFEYACITKCQNSAGDPCPNPPSFPLN